MAEQGAENLEKPSKNQDFWSTEDLTEAGRRRWMRAWSKGFLEARYIRKINSNPVLSTPMTHQGGLADFDATRVPAALLLSALALKHAPDKR